MAVKKEEKKTGRQYAEKLHIKRAEYVIYGCEPAPPADVGELVELLTATPAHNLWKLRELTITTLQQQARELGLSKKAFDAQYRKLQKQETRTKLAEQQLEAAMSELEKIGSWDSVLMREELKQNARYAVKRIRAMSEGVSDE